MTFGQVQQARAVTGAPPLAADRQVTDDRIEVATVHGHETHKVGGGIGGRRDVQRVSGPTRPGGLDEGVCVALVLQPVLGRPLTEHELCRLGAQQRVAALVRPHTDPPSEMIP